MRCGFLFLGINLCMYENGGVGLKKKERKKKKEEEEEEKKNVGVGLKKEKKKMMLVMWQCTGEGAHWDNLFMGLPLSHGSWVLKIVEMCFIFPLHHSFFWVTESPNMSHGVQIRCLPWAPSVLDHEWWKQDYITQNLLHPNMLLTLSNALKKRKGGGFLFLLEGNNLWPCLEH